MKPLDVLCGNGGGVRERQMQPRDPDAMISLNWARILCMGFMY